MAGMAGYTKLILDKPAVEGNIGDWQTRHMTAVRCPVNFERPIVRGLQQWLRYADMHDNKYGTQIGEDYVLGKHWFDMGLAFRGLLNGETGRLDCGTLDHVILTALKQAGFDIDSL